MDYQIAFSPDVGVSTADFVAAWNATPECQAVAEAQLGQPSHTQYDPALLGGAVAVLGGVALGVVSNAVYDLIKNALIKQGVRKRTEIQQFKQPDGTELLVVTIVEE